MTFLDEGTQILHSITTLKAKISSIIEPDFGLLDHLFSLKVLTRREFVEVRSERTVYKRNDALLDLLVSEDKCVGFLTALQRTGQQHAVNFITENGGQKDLSIDYNTWQKHQ